MRVHSTAATIAMVAALLGGTNGAAAQNRPQVVTVEYMKVAPGQDDAYLQVEQKMWKPIHEARVKAGKAIAWYLYRVASPSGTLVDHNYVTVAVYNSFEATENPYPDDLLAKIVPAQSMTEFMRKTGASRELVRSEMWEGIADMFISSPLGSKPAPFLNVAFMKVPAGGESAYLEVEKLWKKMHELRVKEGTLVSWGVYARILPEGSDYPYNFATTNAYARYKDLNGLDFQATFQKADLGMGANELAERTAKSRDLVRGEIWVLIDAVQAPPK
jgi:hypothetical protein